eukprot:527457-Rhodomonas_salina.1
MAPGIHVSTTPLNGPAAAPRTPSQITLTPYLQKQPPPLQASQETAAAFRFLFVWFKYVVKSVIDFERCTRVGFPRATDRSSLGVETETRPARRPLRSPSCIAHRARPAAPGHR